MKKKTAYMVLSGWLILLWAAASVFAAGPSTRVVQIQGMMCDKCVSKVQAALSDLAGVRAADVAVGQATLVADETVSDEDIKAVIAQAGYQVTRISAAAAPDQAGPAPALTNLALTGILIDEDCKDVAVPEEHTLRCLKMPECQASGLGVLTRPADGSSKFFRFDSRGQELAKSQIIDKTARPSNISISVKGLWDGQTLTLESISESTAPAEALQPAAGNIPGDIKGHWAEQSIRQFIAAGYEDVGEGALFKPDAAISRYEWVVLVNRVFPAASTDKTAGFSDVPPESPLAREVAQAVAAGYINGYPDGSFQPDHPVSRTEAAVMLAKALALDTRGPISAAGFSDITLAPAWGRDALAAVTAQGYFNGYPDGTIRPERPITRAEAATILGSAAGRERSGGEHGVGQ